jgi:hypothetical protein
LTLTHKKWSIDYTCYGSYYYFCVFALTMCYVLCLTWSTKASMLISYLSCDHFMAMFMFRGPKKFKWTNMYLFYSKDYNIFSKNNFIKGIFCNLLLKIFIISLIYHIFLLIILNKYEFFKMCKCCQPKKNWFENDQNFKSYQNMLIILRFIFFHYKLHICFICHVHYISLTLMKDFWNFNVLKHTLILIFLIPHLFYCERFFNLGNRLLSS